MQRYFIQEQMSSKQLILSNDIFHHSIHVMRQKIDDQFIIVDKNQKSYLMKITQITSTEVTVELVKQLSERSELPVSITIACAFPKGDKLEWITQKGTELGVSGILAYPSQFSVVRWDEKKQYKKTQRLQKIAQEASEQSHRLVVPKVKFYSTFLSFLADFKDFDHILVAYEESAKQGEKAGLVQTFQQVQKGERILVIFGPEGGFSKEEIHQMTQQKGRTVGLGPRILRAETAPLYVLSACSYALELEKE